MTTSKEAETEAPVVEQPPATEEPKVEEKPLKEKKPRTPREKKPRQPKPKAVAHPPYFQVFLCIFMLFLFWFLDFFCSTSMPCYYYYLFFFIDV